MSFSENCVSLFPEFPAGGAEHLWEQYLRECEHNAFVFSALDLHIVIPFVLATIVTFQALPQLGAAAQFLVTVGR